MAKARRGSISAKIKGLSNRLMAILTASAVVSVLAMGFALYASSLFLQYTYIAVDTGAIQEDGLEARLDAMKFRINGDLDISADFEQNMTEILEVSSLIRATGRMNEESLAGLERSETLIGEYSAAFSKIVELREPRNELVEELIATGRQVRVNLSEIMESAYVDGDPVASFYAGRAQEQLLLGRLYMERFLLNNQQVSFDRAMEAFSKANTGLDELIPELQNPRRRELALGARAQIERFTETSQAVFELIVERNAARATMDQVGPEFIASVEFVMDQVTQKQEVLGSRLQQVGWGMILLLILSSGLFVLYAKRTSIKTASYIKTSIDKYVEAMTELANGHLEFDLGRLPDSGTELARMGDALAVFRDNGIEKEELQKAQAAQEERQAAEREAQQKRDEQAQAESQRRIEEERQALLQRLEKSVGMVVDSAARGDFSQRVKIDFDEQSLCKMAEGINQLLQNVSDGLSATGQVLSALSQGDLTRTVDGNFEGAFKELQENTNMMVGELKTLIGDISGSTVNLACSSGELKETSDVLSRQAEQNAASLEETSTAIEELTASIKQVSENVTNANENARVARETAESSSVVASAAATAMTEISEASTEIARVVTVINDIAFQINLLALNAGVEAARAGEAGRGFSVVASEVRQLSQRASDAAKEIEDVIGRSSEAVTEGVDKVNNARISLDKISESVVGVSQRIDQIASAIDEQVGGVTEINNAVSQIDQNTQKQAASFEELAAASNVLSNEATGLERSTMNFKTGSEMDNPQRSGNSTNEPSTEAQPSKSPKIGTPPPVSGNLAVDPTGWEEF